MNKYQRQKIQCEYCKEMISKININKHRKACKKIFENKVELIKAYNRYGSVDKVAKIYKIGRSDRLSKIFKKWGLDIKSDGGKFKRINSVNDNYFDDMREEQYWLLGLLASDGYIYKNYIGLSQSGIEGLKIIKYINKKLDNKNPIRIQKTNTNNSYKLYFSSKKISSVLRQYGIIENKTKNFKMPNINLYYLKDFIRGYIDGDGSIGVYNNGKGIKILKVSFVGTKDFILDCQKLIPIKKSSLSKHSLSDVYEIRWYGRNALAFCKWCYQSNNVYKSIKYYKYINYKNNYFPRYLEIKHIKEKVKKDLLLSEKSIEEIGNNYNIYPRSIYKWIKEWENEGIEIPKRKRYIKYNNIFKNNVFNCIIKNPNLSDKEICDKYGIHKSTLYRWKKEWKYEKG